MEDTYPAIILWVSRPPHKELFCVACCDGQKYVGRPTHCPHPNTSERVYAEDWNFQPGELVEISLRFFQFRDGGDGHEITSMAPLTREACISEELDSMDEAYRQYCIKREGVPVTCMTQLSGIKRLKSRWDED